MQYLLIDYSEEKKIFISHNGEEAGVTLVIEKNYSYYMHKSKKFIVKLFDSWVKPDESIGEIINLSGDLIDSIPHPGIKHGTISTGGIVAGDKDYFKFIVSSYSGQQYFLQYYVADKIFKEAGNSIR